MIEVLDQILLGVQLLAPRASQDARGEFVKTFHASAFAELGLDFAPVEESFSTSHRGVLRGMHFQLPPHDHAKLVYCIAGRVTDVVLDLRRQSSEFGRYASAELSKANRRMLFIPPAWRTAFWLRRRIP
jgi:dTDP-4-dehydrorhamnose 3,5-epimerase